jgi:hypothetical protein
MAPPFLLPLQGHRGLRSDEPMLVQTPIFKSVTTSVYRWKILNIHQLTLPQLEAAARH